MTMLKMFMSLAVIAVLVKLAMAASYTIGGPTGGWDTTTDLQTWASSQTFLVGDNLIFQYPPNHDVVEVSKSDFDSCQVSNALQIYNDGATTIPLASPGKRYFICGTIGHCSQGMKVEIDTLAASSVLQPSPLNPSPEASPSSPLPAESPLSDPTMSPKFPVESPMSSPPSNIVSSTGFPTGSSMLPPPLSAANQKSFTIGISFVMILIFSL